ncbi:hypothetical protein [Desertivirga arenae]|uniref:hypothetical protein n=1 Tax=Desertivirga arenae TaxID=2810309 RepID=UPI001A96D90C|nr:hypothetical protein [Pedobacter sp. SYSU D00823]
MRRLKHLIFTVFLAFPCISQAQGDQKQEKKASITVSTDLLQYFNDIYKYDIEGKKTDSHLSHFLSIELVNGRTNNQSAWYTNSGTDPISGFGLGIHQKWVARKGNPKSTPYIAYGIGLRKVFIKYSAVGFSRYTENSLDYYIWGPYNDKVEIKSGMANAIGGIQFKHSTNIVLDGYFGIAYKISDSNSLKIGSREYNKTFSSFAFEGLGFQVGAKLGFKVY